jgi:hypothetical protein
MEVFMSKDIQLTDLVGGERDGWWAEGYVLRLAPVYGPGGKIAGNEAVLLNDQRAPPEICTVRNCTFLQRNLPGHTALLKEHGFQYGETGWRHPKEPVARTYPHTLIQFPKGIGGPIPPDMVRIMTEVRAMGLQPRRMP